MTVHGTGFGGPDLTVINFISKILNINFTILIESCYVLREIVNVQLFFEPG